MASHAPSTNNRELECNIHPDAGLAGLARRLHKEHRLHGFDIRANDLPKNGRCPLMKKVFVDDVR